MNPGIMLRAMLKEFASAVAKIFFEVVAVHSVNLRRGWKADGRASAVPG